MGSSFLPSPAPTQTPGPPRCRALVGLQMATDSVSLLAKPDSLSRIGLSATAKPDAPHSGRPGVVPRSCTASAVGTTNPNKSCSFPVHKCRRVLQIGRPDLLTEKLRSLKPAPHLRPMSLVFQVVRFY